MDEQRALSIEQNALALVLKWCKPVIDNKSLHPVLTCVTLGSAGRSVDTEHGSGPVTVSATDLETTIRCVVADSNCGRVRKTFVLPHKELSVLAAPEKKGAKGDVSLTSETSDEKPRCRITTPVLTATLKEQDSAGWPNLFPSNLDWGYPVLVDRTILLDELEWVARALPLSGESLFLDRMKISAGEMVCLDGHRLHRSTQLPLLPDCELAHGSVDALIKLLKEAQAEKIGVRVATGAENGEEAAGRRWIEFSFAEGCSVTCLEPSAAQPSFPPYNRVLPAVGELVCTVKVDTRKLALVVKRFQKLEKQVELQCQPAEGKLVLAPFKHREGTVTSEVAASITGELPSMYNGMFVLRGKYLSDMINKQTGEVTIGLPDDSKVVRFDTDGNRIGALARVAYKQ